MTPHALHWLAQDRVSWRGLGKLWLTLGAVVWMVGLVVWIGWDWVCVRRLK